MCEGSSDGHPQGLGMSEAEGKGWKVGEYDCCGGSRTCANNRTKQTADGLIELALNDKGKAQVAIYDLISNLEEDNEMLRLYVRDLRLHAGKILRVSE